MESLAQAGGFRTKFGRTLDVFSRTARYRRGVGIGLAACVATVLVALALPVPTPEPGTARDRQSLSVGTDLSTLAPEDLRLFLDSRRWGGETLQEVQRRAVDAEATAAERRATDRVGLLGLVQVEDRRTSLIQLPDGEIVRFVSGGTLPDGRRVKTMTSRAVTLEGDEGGRTEHLDLFPPIRQKPGLVAPDDATRGPAVEPDAKPAG